jgi:apolipoprotein D and lipocalin family protein
MKYVALVLVCFLIGCVSIPDDIKPVENFDADRYLGQWFEVARLDHSFERGLQQVTADYTMREGGGIKVVNRGFNVDEQQWQEAEGKAFFVGEEDTAHLKVSFFGPFYGSYIVFELDQNYQYAFVTSSSKSYLWLLSRSPTIDEELKTHFIKTVKKLGFDDQALIFVNQQSTAADMN